MVILVMRNKAFMQVTFGPEAFEKCNGEQEIIFPVHMKISHDTKHLAMKFHQLKGAEIPNMLPFSGHRETFKKHLDFVKDKPGAMIEFGTAQGGSSRQLARLAPERQLYTFDVMTGLDARDVNIEIDNRSEVGFGNWLITPDMWLPMYPNVEFIGGRLEDTLPNFEKTRTLHELKFILAYVDVNTLKSTTEALTFLEGKMLPGGLIVIDDYEGPDKCEGAYRATNEFFERNADKMCLRMEHSKDLIHEARIYVKEEC